MPPSPRASEYRWHHSTRRSTPHRRSSHHDFRFSFPITRGVAMATAAETIRVQNFIDGSTSGGAAHGPEPVLNPATGEQIATAPLSGESDVDAAVQAAKRAFP